MASLLSQAPVVNLRSANDLALLHKLECRACPLNKTVGTNMQPTGSDHPLVLILGEAPGADEVDQGGQFVGASGQLLRPLIPRKFRDHVRFNNVVRSRTPGNATPERVMIEACRPSIIRDIEQTKPKAIFGFGNVPLEWVSGFSRITEWRARKMPVKVGNHTCWFYPMLHPSDLLRNRKGRDRSIPSDEEFMFRFDMKRAFAEVDGLPPAVVHTVADVRRNVEIVIGNGVMDMKKVKEALKWAKQQAVVGVDYETNGLRPYPEKARILTAAVATAEFAFAFPFDHPESQWSASERQEVGELWQDFLVNAKGVKAVHNLAFEQEWTGVKFGKKYLRAGRWACTQVQASILDERKGKNRKAGPLSLEFLVQQYFGFNLKKLAGVDRKNLENEPIEAVLQYNAPDSRYHALLCEKQLERIEAEGLWESYELALRAVPTVVLTQMKGLPIDQLEVKRLGKKYDAKIKEVIAKIEDLPVIKDFERTRNKKFTPLSNPDVITVLKEFLHRTEILVEDKYTKKRHYSADESVLEQIDHPLANLLLDLRKFNKRRSTYVDPLAEGAETLYSDGCVHAVFNTTFTDTGRLSCVRKGTPIQVPGGTCAIEKVKVGDWVYAYDHDRKLVLRKVTNTWYRGRKKLVRLRWVGSGRHHKGFLDVTPDHRVRLVSGEYLPAEQLADMKFSIEHSNGVRWYNGARVMALHRGLRSGGYLRLYPTGAEARKEARIVFEGVYGWFPEHIHHKDENKQNDRPENLEGLTHREHTSLHARNLTSEEISRRMKTRSPATVARVSQAVAAGLKARAAARYSQGEIESALQEGKGIKGAARLLGCDAGTVKARVVLWEIPATFWDGRKYRKIRPERRGRKIGPYKGRAHYGKAWQKTLDKRNNHVVVAVEDLPGTHPVYDLEVEGANNFIAGEICVHNCEHPNLQNFPKRVEGAAEVRKQIVCLPGHVGLAFDMGQLEARIIACFTKDERFCKALWERYDVHKEWAERIAYAYPRRVGGKKMLTDKKVMKDFRTDIKNQWTFPLFFGAKLESAAGYLNIPSEIIKPQYDEFWRQFSGVRDWQEKLKEFYDEYGYVECLTGRRRRGPLSLNQILNSPIQGTAAALVLDAMSRLSEIGDDVFQPEINIHDDLTFLRVPEKQVDDVAERIITEMLKAPFSWINVPLTVEMAVGKDWLNMEHVADFSSDTWFK